MGKGPRSGKGKEGETAWESLGKGFSLEFDPEELNVRAAMKTCVSFEDLLQIHRPQIEEMQRIGESLPHSISSETAVSLVTQVRIVEGVIRQTYREAAVLAKRTEDLREVAQIWEGMSSFCNAALQALRSLKERFNYDGTAQLYDLALDYKLACDKRHLGVWEEIACQSTEFPKGLFPEKM